jgi:hypothetical protein
MHGKITNYAEGLLKIQYDCHAKYAVLQMSPVIWKVKQKVISNTSSVYPTFSSTRTVVLQQAQFLVCECGQWQRFGIPC